MPEQVRCADCGYLAVRKVETRELVDAEDVTRSTGAMPALLGNRGNAYEDWPICFVRAFNLREEFGPKLPGGPERKEVITRERPCTAFTDWQQGFTPKEHAEMLQETARLRWQESREEADRGWRDKQEEKAESRHRDNLKGVIDAGKSNVWSQLVAGAIGAVATLLAVWAAAQLNKPPQITIQPPQVTITAPTPPALPDIDH